VGYPFCSLNDQFIHVAYRYLLLGLAASERMPRLYVMSGETLEPAYERESAAGRCILAEEI
jgi:hypothetical protein